MKKIILICISTLLITSCAQIKIMTGITQLSNEQKINQVIASANDYYYNGKYGHDYKKEILGLSKEKDFTKIVGEKIIGCYSTSLFDNRQGLCAIIKYGEVITEIIRINSEESKKQWEYKLLLSAKQGKVEPNNANINYFCGVSTNLKTLVGAGVSYKITAERARKILARDGIGYYAGKDVFSDEYIKKLDAYKVLKITSSQLKSIRSHLEMILSQYEYPSEANLNSNYYELCFSDPENYIYNYNLIFKK